MREAGIFFTHLDSGIHSAPQKKNDMGGGDKYIYHRSTSPLNVPYNNNRKARYYYSGLLPLSDTDGGVRV